MRLGIDAHRLCGRRLGVGRYLEYLLKHWKQPHPFDSIELYAPCAIDPGTVASGDRLRFVSFGGSLPLFFFHNLLMSRHARDLDLLFCPAYFAPVDYRAPYVVTHHGSYEAIQQSFPWWHRYRYSFFYAQAARRARHVITVSESSKRDIVRFYGVAPDRIHVIYYGVDEAFTAVRDAERVARLKEEIGAGDRPIVLYVGKLSARRSIGPLLEAFADVRKSRRLPHLLVLVGPNHLGVPLDREVRRLGFDGSFRHLDYMGHDCLPTLYQAADVFVYPSTYEGFGMPVVEAMASGTPVITLDNTAFRETAAGAAYLAPEGTVDELRRALDTVLTNPALRQDLSQKGIERARRFSWVRTATETLDVLTDAARSAR